MIKKEFQQTTFHGVPQRELALYYNMFRNQASNVALYSSKPQQPCLASLANDYHQPKGKHCPATVQSVEAAGPPQ